MDHFWNGVDVRPSLQIMGSAFPAAGGGSPVTIGQTGLGGAGNWPTSADRALMSKAVVSATTDLTQFNLRTTAASTSGEQYKGLMYAADGIGGNPSTLLAYTVASAVVGAGVQLVTMAVVGTPSIAAQNVWIGYVAAGTAGGAGGETDSGAAGAAGDSIMLNGGETNYTTPSNPAGNWPGSPGPYSNKGAFWWDGTA